MKENIGMKHVKFTLQYKLLNQLSKNVRKEDILIKIDPTDSSETYNQENNMMK